MCPVARCRRGLRRDPSGSALPTLPQSVSRGTRFSRLHWFAFATACQVARPPGRIGPSFPGPPGAFTSRLSAGLAPFSAPGYDHNSHWTPLLAGLSPAGMAASLAAPDPSGPNSGSRLPPWVSDGEAFTRPGVKDVRSGEPGIGHLRHPPPCAPVFLAAPPQRAPPQVGHMVAEGHKGTAVRWHRMISKVAADPLRQPAPRGGDGRIQAPPQRVLAPPQRRPHAVGATVPLELEGA